MVPSVLYGRQKPGERRIGTIPDVSTTYTQDEEGWEPPIISTPSAPPYARSGSSSAIRQLLLSLGAIISVAAFVVIFSVCSVWNKRKHVPGATLRRLSDDGDGLDDDELSVIEGCLTLEAELGILRQRAASQSDADPEARVEGIVSVLQAAAAEHEATLGLLALWDSIPVSHAASGRIQQRADEDLTGMQSAVQPQDKEAVYTSTAPTSASATNEGSLDAAHALGPDAWLDTNPELTRGEGEHDKANLAQATVSKSDDAQTSSSEPPPLDAACVSGAMPGNQSHPYVRLPLLAEGLVIRHIDVDNLFKPYLKRIDPHFFLSKMRRLFAKEVLEQDDVDILVRETEGLIGSAWYQAHKKFRKNRPVYAAEAFGKYFLALDAIVCAIQILGDSMQLSSWWAKFVDPFDRDPSRLPPSSNTVGGVHRRMVSRLRTALAVYKTARRPSLGEVIALKKMLFFPPTAPVHFNDDKWDQWREDGKDS